MSLFKKIPHPITILALIIAGAAILTWLVPAGKYDTLTYSKEGKSFIISSAGGEQSLPATQQTLHNLHILIRLQSFVNGDIRKPVSVPGTYQRTEPHRQGISDVLKAPLSGIYDTIDIILFVLVTGGFIRVFQATGAMEEGLARLSVRMKGKEGWLIILLTFLFTFGGASYGMAEEGLAFYPVLIPLFLAAGYDLLVPVAVIFGGTQLGTLSSFSNPFSTIIASNAAGISWTDGLYGRLSLFVITAAILIVYIVRYAEKVKRNPALSLVYRIDGIAAKQPETNGKAGISTKSGKYTAFLLILFLFTFLFMIYGVVFLGWWLLEMSAMFVVSSILVAVIIQMGEKAFISGFISGAGELLGVAFIIGVARGVSLILAEGNISDSIVYYAAQLAGTMPSSVFIVLLLLLYMVFTLFISSSSGMAVVTMPVMGSLAVMAGVPGREIVNAYLFGMGVMGFVTPTGLILPSLALAGVSYKTWLRFCWPLLLILMGICTLSLLAGICL
jgi:uncharacterized ion transporter superfamily protein YfcC